jgi:hypothetical protein
MKYLLGYFQINLHESLRFAIYHYYTYNYGGVGFVIGDGIWTVPVPFDEMFRSGYAWSDIGEIEYYECDS